MRFLRGYATALLFALIGIGLPALIRHDSSWGLCASLAWAYLMGIASVVWAVRR